MSEQTLLERKQALKNRISALAIEKQPHLRAVENLSQRIDVLEDDLRKVMDAISAEDRQRRAEMNIKKPIPRKEWTVNV
jgi:hypothetical protein